MSSTKPSRRSDAGQRAGVKRPRTPPSCDQSHLPSKATADQLRTLVAPHVDSFNQFLTDGLEQAVADIPEQETQLGPNGPSITMWYENVDIGYPGRSGDEISTAKLTPRECRERGLAYTAPITANVMWRIGDGEANRMQKRMGDCPIMVRSKRCHLATLSPREMVALREEDSEVGGYFIVSGIERVVRLLQVCVILLCACLAAAPANCWLAIALCKCYFTLFLY
jgi:DNA-directed RNA polymerase I subunit RPA2